MTPPDTRRLFHDLRRRLHSALPSNHHRAIDNVLSDFAVEMGVTTRGDVMLGRAISSILARPAEPELEPPEPELELDANRAGDDDDPNAPEGGWLEPDPEIAAEYERTYNR